MLPRYYLNDYFTLLDSPMLKEREYMKTDIREYQNKYIMEIDMPGLRKEDIIVKQMYPTLRPDLMIVDITNSYNIVPFKIYRENIDKLLFVYGGTFNFYGYYAADVVLKVGDENLTCFKYLMAKYPEFNVFKREIENAIKETLNKQGLKNGDINKDGKINMTDIIKLRKYLAGKEKL